jgi:hypothetical protein
MISDRGADTGADTAAHCTAGKQEAGRDADPRRDKAANSGTLFIDQ